MSIKSVGACVSAILALSVAASAARAQSEATEPEPLRLEDIVVTAQKRAENIQSVPISVSAVTGDAIASQQITNILSLANSIPNVQINTFSNSPDSAVFTIRGIGVNDADPYVGTTVSVIVDGVVVGVNTGALLQLFDIDRVEILRGPQGTLFGANTTGGVINVVTKQPTGVLEGEAQVVAGNYGRLNANAALNFPITDNLAGKISVLHMGHDGFFRNTIDNSRLGGTNVTTLRGYLKYTLDNYDATLISEYVRSRNGSQTALNLADPTQALYVPGQTDQGLRFRRGQSRGQPDFNNRDSYSFTLTQDFDTSLGDVVSISNYREYRNELWSDDDAVEPVLLQSRRNTMHSQYSQELRTTIDVNDRTQLMVGGFYFHQKYLLTHFTNLDGFLVGLGQPQLQDQKNWSLSGFTQLYFKLTDQLRLQAGFRYSHEKTRARSVTANSLSPSPGVILSDFSDAGNLIPGSLVDVSGRKSWDEVGYKLGLDYNLTDDMMLYGYYARGFKSGGFAGRIAVPEDIGPFDPEKVDTFEVGMKSDFLDGRLRANVAAFYNIYKDMQVTQNITYLDGRNSSSIFNAGKSKTKGFEVELTALPLEGLTLSASVAYLDAKYKRYDTLKLDPATNTLVPASFAGNRLMNAPKFTGTASVSYTVPMGAGETNIFVQNAYTSPKYSYFDNLPQQRIGAVNLVNATLSWTPESDRWSIGLYGRNILDRRYPAQLTYLPGTFYLVAMGPPREYGVDFKYKW